MSGPSGAPGSNWQQARSAQRKTLDIAHELYPGVAVKLLRNTERTGPLDGVQRNACVLVRKDGDTLTPLLFASSWAKLYALTVDVRRDRARARDGGTPCP